MNHLFSFLPSSFFHCNKLYFFVFIERFLHEIGFHVFKKINENNVSIEKVDHCWHYLHRLKHSSFGNMSKEEEVQMISLNNNVEVENTVKFISFRDFNLEFSKGKTIS